MSPTLTGDQIGRKEERDRLRESVGAAGDRGRDESTIPIRSETGEHVTYLTLLLSKL